MDARLGARRAALLLCMAASSAQADLYLCATGDARRVIQDKPCGKNARVEAQVRDGQPVKPQSNEARPKAAAARAKPGSKAAPIAVGVENNKAVICELLDAEKRDTLAQMNGTAAAPAGENPKDNLAKIERQRSRVGCS